MGLPGRVTVAQANELVTEIDSLSADQFRALMVGKARAEIESQYLTAKCLTSLWHFLWWGPYKRARRHYWPESHRPLCDFLQDWTRVDEYGHTVRVPEKVVSAFRSFNKSQVCSILYPAWRIGQDPDIRGFVRSHKDPEAVKVSRQIRDILTHEDYVNVFPWVRPAMDGTRRVKWSEGAFLVAREEPNVKTNTIEAAGRESSVTGNHYHFRLYDDWEYEGDAHSQDAQEEIVSKHRLDEALMLPGSNCLNVGTPYCNKLYIDGALKGCGFYADRDFQLFVMPAEVQVFDAPWIFQEPILCGDRQTFRCEGAGFPTLEADLERCQVKATFYSSLVNDTIVESREVVWNDGQQVRINRPLPEVLGQPIRLEVSATKIACPIKHTYDSQDVDIEYEGAPVIRESLPGKRVKFGAGWYASQMMLNPLNPESVVWNRTQVKIIKASELPPEGARHWYRAVDLASSRKTNCRTAITTGFLHERGLYITHGIAGNLRKVDILFELFLGVLRARELGGVPRWTSFELQGREEMLGEDLMLAQRNPLKYFALCGEPWKSRAEAMFMAGGQALDIRVPVHSITRPAAVRKSQRIMSLDPWYCSGEVYILDTVPYLELYLDEVDTFTLEGDVGFDIHDTVADIVREGARPRTPKKVDTRTHDFMRSQRDVRRRLMAHELYGTERAV